LSTSPIRDQSWTLRSVNTPRWYPGSALSPSTRSDDTWRLSQGKSWRPNTTPLSILKTTCHKSLLRLSSRPRPSRGSSRGQSTSPTKGTIFIYLEPSFIHHNLPHKLPPLLTRSSLHLRSSLLWESPLLEAMVQVTVTAPVMVLAIVLATAMESEAPLPPLLLIK
jgi:hypothetical protein